REAAAACGRARVLDPVAAELVRYREVREQYATVVGSRTSVRVVGGHRSGTRRLGATRAGARGR
ncbi:ATP-binding protein, partial [Streptomyces sp. SID2131]|nr:ATP-binding protein [Streptomyces sp. SID2131]